MSIDSVTSPIFDAFKHLLWDTWIKLILTKLFTSIPLLGWGPFGMIISFFINKYGDQIYEILKYTIQVELIVLKNEALKNSFVTAKVKLAIIFHSTGANSQEFKNARKIHQDTLAKFVSYEHAS